MLPARQIYKYTALSRFSSETQHSTNSRLAIASPNDPKIRAQNEDSRSCIVHRSLRFMAINLLPSSKNPRPLTRFLGLIETQANGKFRRLFTSRLGSSLITLTS
ncbi:hypothetical protein CK203_047343 [Vitis vinifera]|uniref:Uncharacterized protein n=1 Tax=Vitis vinifera TaxID=29760 RepID=A0A438HHZ2_VITVI|nr:hypothetical protein CK203_047343 [Vitis vinifera]